MGVLAFGDAFLINKLKTLTEEGSFAVGLVIASKNEDNYYLTHLSPMSDVEEDISTESDEKKGTTETQVVKPSSISSLSEVALTLHASQVVRMLPGGLDVAGIYIVAPMSELNNLSNQGKLRVILNNIHKLTSSYIGTEISSLEKLVLFGCTQSFKFGIKSIDISEHGKSLVSGSLKTQDNKWIQLNYRYSLSYPIYFPTEKDPQSLRKSVSIYLQSWAQSLRNTIILLDGKEFNEDSEISLSDCQSKKKGKSVEESILAVLNAEILENQNKSEMKEISEFQECYGSAVFSGNVAGKAYVNWKAKASDGFAAIRNDLIRTMFARWEMHCDSLVEEPHGSLTEPVLHEPPRRVFLQGGNSAVSLCDYLFPGDTIADACQSARELFDIVVEESDVNDTLESWADPAEFRKPEALSSSYGNANYEEGTSVKHVNAFQFGIAVIIGILAMIIAYYVITLKR